MDFMSSTEKSNLEIDLKILNISCQPRDVLITFQAKYISESKFDYHILEREIQLVKKNYEDIDIGQFCLVQDKPHGTWYRGKILDKVNEKLEVVLIDQGNVISVPFPQIASATGELFILPPKVVNGIISNLLPLEEKWTSRDVKYFSSLVGQQLHGNVKTFLPHQVILLEIPKVITYATELCVAKYVDSETFCLLVEILHKFPANSHGKQMPDLLQQKEICSDVMLAIPDNLPRFQKILGHLRPEICVNTMEKIKISAAISPDRFFCHIVSWAIELSKLTASMCSHYETTLTGESSTLGSYGVLCAAKRKDGSWYRGVIQKLISCNDVKIWFMDIGSSETIQSSSVQRLQPEFLSLPMMAIPCALTRDKHHIESVRSVQQALFTEALMGHVVIAHIEDFNSEEHLYYLSLYDKEFEFSIDCHLSNEQIPHFSPHSYIDIAEPVIDEKSQNLTLPETSTSLEMEYSDTVSYTSMKMDLESIYVAYVEYVINPSNFWIRIDDSQKDFTKMMAEIAEKYSKCEIMDMVLQNPKPGQLCCAVYALDGHYYRAVITKVLSPQISVYYIDFGNTETVPFYDVKVLLPQFSVLPAFAICCSLAYACPVEDVWVKSANDFFKETVSGKALLCHVLAKQKCKYVVEMRLAENSKSSDIVTLLVQAGFAEFWKVDLNSNSNLDCQSLDCNTKCNNIGKHKRNTLIRTGISQDAHVSLGALSLKLNPTEPKYSFCMPASSFTVCYKQHVFKPGAVMDVKCSHVDSPASFWCQLSSSNSALCTLMDEMQNVYSCCNSLYQHGQVACAAKSPSTGKYYRAAVIKYVSAHEVQVIFIDYGNTEKVLLSELREIKPQFLELEGQAFRCCLSQVFSPPLVHYEWSANACEDFKRFVQSTPDVMKCTIVALFSSNSMELCNAVNLEAHGNVNKKFMDNSNLVLRNNVPTFQLHTFCYSNFDLDVGSKEDVCVTFIYSTGRFYCHLAKNEKKFSMLMKKVAKIGEMSKPVMNRTEVCFVKYIEDGKLYRAFACPVESSLLFLAFFVDFGDSQVVKRNELLNIPEGAYDILFEPMQAIPCFLAGMKESLLTVEAKAWFTEECVGKLLSAVVVAIDHEGQLEVELYDGNVSINQKIQQLMGIKPFQDNLIFCENTSTAKNQHGSDSIDSLPINTVQKKAPSTHVAKSLEINDKSLSCRQTFIKAVDLPQIFLEAGTTCLAYVSHIDSPSSFFVQLDKQEEEIIQLDEELNKMALQVIDKQDIKRGLIVVAQYPEDKAYYRAEIKDHLQDSVGVEFIDYGNVANVDSSCIFNLPEQFSTSPRLSIPVFLTGVLKLQNHTEWSKNITKMFTDKIKSEQFDCKFMHKHGLQWEVSITLKGKSLSEELLQSFECFSKVPTAVTKENTPKSDLSYCNISSKSTSEKDTADKNIDRICTKSLKPGLIEKVKNIFLSDFGTLFVTLANFSEESKINLLIGATVRQSGNELSVKDISEGMVCLAKSERMQVWLRASVEKRIPSTVKMAVFFVDHGAREVISMNNAKMLSIEALSIPKQAIVCKWPGTEQIDENVFKAQLKLILQQEIKIIFLEFMESISAWKVEILVNGLLLSHYLHSLQSSADIKLDRIKFQSQALSPQIPRKNLKPLEVCPGFVTSFHDPSSFFVQLADSLDIMAALSQLMQMPDDLTPIASDSLKQGSSCLVQSFDKQEWSRAEIMSINKDFILLYLPDHGVDKIIPYSDYGQLRMIPAELSCLPALIYHCTLYGVMPVEGNWSKDAIKYCISFVQNHDLMILPVKHLGRNVLEVSLYGQGNLAHNLVKKGLAKEQIVDDTF
ncbi:tudor domain-containing protein 15 [Hyla sarda]|uniref:tudor domain-containing protein 15 n=1 Tax=Hyla sarda TaxID=327740 RepID=UPI0024C34838|nr:tudor domain-containing protein 15 [Hyla sarda]XP_056420270.1 tudor domain-containing protein 15 [Hyla sarda]XP_056420271.1 tudor domain-containing protein 15 [Hyla sarda]XP_056420272.1 tudor domain-containing protein 15 [Hyla sarda]XP_056420273.1 tudor domain-containing protein 15 [Hyla sarda]XP_056420274.1 tudor domain-containing protein 15 [Hyla sarda]XP_056420275.1 tudor domain-containing protein 15 [Hyla sarda]XP_056420276.1 tudor domain-containing protein 15 [Hyla sarda]